MKLSLFPAYFDHPEKMRFAEQEEDEFIIVLLRAHWITNVPWIIISLVWFIVPILVYQLIHANYPIAAFNPSTFITQAIIVLIYVSLTIYVVEKYLSWYFNVYIITNYNIVDVNFLSFLSKDVKETRVSDVVQKSAPMTGIFSSLFNYGNVVLETPSKGEPLVFHNVPYPNKVVDVLGDLQEDQKGNQ